MRWSSHGFRSDFYAYESDAGFELWVAAARHPDGCPTPNVAGLAAGTVTVEQVHAAMEAQRAWLDDPANAPKPIRLPFDGCQWTFDTETEMWDKIAELVDVGYRTGAPEGDRAFIAAGRAASPE